VLVRRQRRPGGPGTARQFLLGQAGAGPDLLEQFGGVHHPSSVSDEILYPLGYQPRLALIGPKFLQGYRPRRAELRTAWHPALRPGASPASHVRDNPETVIPGQIRTLPAEITNRTDRFRRTSAAPDILRRAGHPYLCRRWPQPLPAMAQTPMGIGLDQCPSMFAPCLLGCPGTPRQHPVSPARRGSGRPDRMAAPGMC
jgi:hypothetical protein